MSDSLLRWRREESLKISDVLLYKLYLWGLPEKLTGWPRCSNGMWPNQVYFST